MSTTPPQIDLVTLGVSDVTASKRFYADGLGWEVALELESVVFLRAGYGRLLSVFAADSLEADVAGPDADVAAVRGAGVAIGQVVETEEEVSAVIDRAAAAGGTVLKPAQWAEFGGFHGYFADPDGFRWEVATNPGWSVDPDGRVQIKPIEG